MQFSRILNTFQGNHWADRQHHKLRHLYGAVELTKEVCGCLIGEGNGAVRVYHQTY